MALEQTYINVTLPIAQGSIQNPYKEFSITVAPQTTETLSYVFDYFRILSLSGDTNACNVRFGGSGSETIFSSAGLGYKLLQPVDRVSVRNSGATPLIITVAVGVGFISDDRLNVSGTVNVAGIVDIEGSTTIANSQVTVSNTAVIISAASATKNSVTIYNKGVTSVFIGTSSVTTSNGLEIEAGASYVISTKAVIYGIRAAVSTEVVGILEEFI